MGRGAKHSGSYIENLQYSKTLSGPSKRPSTSTPNGKAKAWGPWKSNTWSWNPKWRKGVKWPGNGGN